MCLKSLSGHQACEESRCYFMSYKIPDNNTEIRYSETSWLTSSAQTNRCNNLKKVKDLFVESDVHISEIFGTPVVKNQTLPVFYFISFIYDELMSWLITDSQTCDSTCFISGIHLLVVLYHLFIHHPSVGVLQRNHKLLRTVFHITANKAARARVPQLDVFTETWRHLFPFYWHQNLFLKRSLRDSYLKGILETFPHIFLE